MKDYKKIFKDINNQIEPRDEFIDKLKNNLKEKIEEKKKKNLLIKKISIIITLVIIICCICLGIKFL